jgi:ATP-dependent DNA helicase RecQ
VDQGVLSRSPGEYPVLVLNAESAKVLKGTRAIELVEPKMLADRLDGPVADGAPTPALTPAEIDLFESLRALRRDIAAELAVPPYVIFGDTTLEEMSRVRPGSDMAFVSIKGVGQTKLGSFGPRFLQHIREHCARNGLQLDAVAGSRPRQAPIRGAKPSRRTRPAAAEMFAQGLSVDQVAEKLGVVRNTASAYLSDYILSARPASVDAWIEPKTYAAIADAAGKHGTTMLRPIFDHLGGSVPYDQIRVVVSHLQASTSQSV